MDANTITPAMDRMSVVPGPETGDSPILGNKTSGRADAGTDVSITERLERNPESKEARLDRALDESMDASDPPASTQPIHRHHTEIPESSGYDAKREAKLAAASGEKGVIGKLLSKIGIG